MKDDIQRVILVMNFSDLSGISQDLVYNHIVSKLFELGYKWLKANQTINFDCLSYIMINFDNEKHIDIGNHELLDNYEKENTPYQQFDATIGCQVDSFLEKAENNGEYVKIINGIPVTIRKDCILFDSDKLISDVNSQAKKAQKELFRS